MPITVGVKEAKRRMYELVAAARDGQDVIITRYKIPLVRLQATTAEEKSRWLAEQALQQALA